MSVRRAIRVPPAKFTKMAAERESESCMDEEMSNLSDEIPQNLNWIYSEKGRQFFHKILENVSNPENEISESSAARTLLTKSMI